MDKNELREQLLRLAAELQNIASKLLRQPTEAKPEERTQCPICNELLNDGTKVVRGVHSRCQKRLERQGVLGEAELSGLLLPKGKSGRKAKDDLTKLFSEPDQEATPEVAKLVKTARKKVEQNDKKSTRKD
jgi:hypothetical protein